MAAICGASLGSARRSRGVERWDNSILCFQVISNQCISSQSSTAITDPDSNADFAPSSETPGGYVGQAGNEHRSPLIPGRRVFPNAVAAVDYRRRHPGELQRGMQRPSVPLTSHLSPLTSHLPKPPSSRCFYDDCIAGGHIALVAAIQHFDTAVLPQN
jgi:hypothetical protein